ncbi:16234_t:CDS:1, partial [Acaulospora morrowiae]
ANPFLTLDELGKEYGCDRSTISKVLKNKQEWLSKEFTDYEAKAIVNRPVKFAQLENALSLWICQIFLQNLILTDGLLQLQAKKFAK